MHRIVIPNGRTSFSECSEESAFRYLQADSSFVGMTLLVGLAGLYAVSVYGFCAFVPRIYSPGTEGYSTIFAFICVHSRLTKNYESLRPRQNAGMAQQDHSDKQNAARSGRCEDRLSRAAADTVRYCRAGVGNWRVGVLAPPPPCCNEVGASNSGSSGPHACPKPDSCH
jgi:hypothetical protein